MGLLGGNSLGRGPLSVTSNDGPSTSLHKYRRSGYWHPIDQPSLSSNESPSSSSVFTSSSDSTTSTPLTALSFGPTNRRSSQGSALQREKRPSNIEIESRDSLSDLDPGPSGHIKRSDLDFLQTVVPCCEKSCGKTVPLVIYGRYTRGGDICIRFSMHNSPSCGIPIERVLRRKLEGLDGRDDLVELTPDAGSMRLQIEVGNSSPVIPPTS